MIKEKNKKISIRRSAVTWFFVILLASSFLLAGNISAYTGDYNKLSDGVLNAEEWNKLITDFVAVRDGGYVGIGTTAPSGKLHISSNSLAENSSVIIEHERNAAYWTMKNMNFEILPNPSGYTGGSAELSGISGTGVRKNFLSFTGWSDGQITVKSSKFVFENNKYISAQATDNPVIDILGLTPQNIVSVGSRYQSGSSGIEKGYGMDLWITENQAQNTQFNFKFLDKDNVTKNLMTLNGINGNVGIGTTSPSRMLDIAGAAQLGAVSYGISPGDSQLLALATVGYVKASAINGTGPWSKNGANVSLSTINDNVGIGIDIPTAKLDISGDAKIRGGVYINTQYISNNIYGFTNGTLISTDIPVSSNQMMELYIEGNSYSGWGAVGGKVTAYNYTGNGTIVGTSYVADGFVPSEVRVFHHDGFVKFWLPTGNAQTYRFRLATSFGSFYKITSLQNLAMPASGVTNEVVMTPKTVINNFVGIGTTNPGYALDVTKNAATQLRVGGGAGVSSTSGIRFGNYDATQTADILFSQLGSNSLTLVTNGNYSTNAIILKPGNVEVMRVIKNGNVGIGTTAPSQKLHVAGVAQLDDVSYGVSPGAGQSLALATVGYVNAAATNGTGPWGRAGTNVSLSNIGDNVGIGTASPSSKLHVIGDIRTPNNSKWDFWSSGPTSDGYIQGGGNGYIFNSYNATSGFNFTKGSPGNSLFFINSSGSVGIGTIAPSQKLELAGDTGETYLLVRDSRSNTGDTAGIKFSTGSNLNQKSMIAHIETGGNARGDLIFAIKPGDIQGNVSISDEVVRIKESGNVGIGTTTPSRKLDVNGDLQLGLVSYGVSPGTSQALALATVGYVNASAINGTGPWAKNGTNVSLSTISDNVGIGTAVAAAKLHIFGKQMVGDGLQNSFIGGATLQIQKQSGNETSLGFWENGVASALIGHKSSDSNLYITNNYSSPGLGASAYSITLNSSGNLGIGTTNPTRKLTVVGGTEIMLMTGSGGNGLLLQDFQGRASFIGYNGSAYNDIEFRSNGTPGSQLYLQTAGNVGIGTTTPSRKLDVAGVTQLGAVSWGITPGQSQNLALSTVEYVNAKTGGSGGVGAGTSGQTLMHNGTGWVANSNLYNNGTNVGIGTTNPASKLSILGNATETGALSVYNSVSGSVPIPQVIFGRNTTEYQRHSIQTSHSTVDTGNKMSFVLYSADTGYNGANWATLGNRTVMTLEGTGNVGIGTTNPTAPLTIQQLDNTSGFKLIGYSDPSTIFSFFIGSGGTNNPRFSSTKSMVFDANQGIYFRGPSGVYLNDNNSGNVYLANGGGNIGIGTTAPQAKLHIETDGNGFNRAILLGGNTATTGAGSYIQFVSSNENYGSQIGGIREGAGSINALVFRTGVPTAERMRIANSGNVGIGTTNPGIYKLNVAGAAQLGAVSFGVSPGDSQLLALATVGYVKASTANGTGPWSKTGTNVSLSTITDNVGIGTATPGAYKLYVNGTAKFTGSVDTDTQFLGQASDTVSAPSYAWTGDLTTGMWRPAASTIAFSTAGTEKMRLNAAGNLGIGTNDPISSLHVEKNSASTLRIQTGVTTELETANLEFGISTNKSLTSGKISSIRTNAGGANSSDMAFYTSLGTVSNERMRILASGNVGIGITDPGIYKLNVAGAAQLGAVSFGVSPGDSQLLALATVGYVKASTANGTGPWSKTGTNVSLSTITDNVGIGTATPGAYKLYVNGTAKFTGSVDTDTQFLGQASDTVSAPSFAWTGDLTTGMWRPAASTIAFSTAGTEKMRLNAAGNLGIGTTNPNNTLTIAKSGASSSQPGIDFFGTISTSGYENTLYNTARLYSGFISAGYNTAYLRLATPTGVNTWIDTLTLMNGNVGIGTTNPGIYKLNVAGAAQLGAVSFGVSPGSTQALALATVGYVNAAATNGTGPWSKTGTNVSLSTITDNVGIGTATPGAYKLYVNGTAKFTGSVDTDTQFLGQASDTVSAPSFAWTGDLTTGMWRPAASTIAFSTAGTEKMRLNAAGNLGIGTTIPDYALDVIKSENYQIRVGGGVGVNSTSGIRFGNYDATQTADILFSQSGSNSLTLVTNGNYSTNAIILKPGKVEVMRALQNGSVGIGITDPGIYKLNVAGAAQLGAVSFGVSPGDSQLLALATVGYVKASTANGTGPWSKTGTNVSLSTITDNVGIGTATPGAYKLYVNGTAKFTGSVDTDTQFLGQASDTVSAPSFAWTGDLTTGMWRPAASTIAFSTAGTEKMRLNAAGNLGVGTNSPGSYRLNVNGNAKVSGITTIESSGDQLFVLKQLGIAGTAGIRDGGWNYMAFLDSEGDRQAYFGISSNGDFVFNPEVSGSKVSVNSNFTINNNSLTQTGSSYLNSFAGSVGIGTTNPGIYKLNVAGAAQLGAVSFGVSPGDSQLLALATVGYVKASATNGTGPWGRTGTNVSLSTISDNVGIGTATPGNKLDVIGNFSVSGIFKGYGASNNSFFEGKLGVNTLSAGASSLSVFGNAAVGNGYLSIAAPDNGLIVQGNVGIGTSSPAERLHIVGNTRIDGGLTLSGNLNMTGATLIVNKITANTIDPLYTINGTKYSTYAPSIVGGVSEEYLTRLTAKEFKRVGTEYETVINFASVKEGSDAWVWRKVVDFSDDNVEIFLTPRGQSATMYAYISGQKLIVRSNIPVDASLRLIGRRHDWINWPTKALDQNQLGGLVIE